ncbi:2OG-Fe(II) oxygenase [Nocardia amamiensis]|uniref:2OG-Fe(II) oxygenase n=1 Tax=Nocardia amamiensis TaxID=404578 RepID=A0ABS0D2I5_9NOCA|nr:2OG-Fe(II) oxygenase [Nocardia amamiensis]
MRGSPGQGHEWHADNVRSVNGRWVANHTPHRDIAGILYLNRVKGGRLRFQRDDIGALSPAAGLYVTFPCGSDYLHHVEPVMCGDRFTMSVWFTTERCHAHPVLVALTAEDRKPH